MIKNEYICVKKSNALKGKVYLSGAKNAALVALASTVLVAGKSTLNNIPDIDDVNSMIELLRSLGAVVYFDKKSNTCEVDALNIDSLNIDIDKMKNLRASILFLGPLLARFKKAKFGLPGGDKIGRRSIDFHLKNFEKMGVSFSNIEHVMFGEAKKLNAGRFVLEYPSVGATENILMAAVLTAGTSYIINAAFEPEVLDLINILKKMGANIIIKSCSIIKIFGVERLSPFVHSIINDRLEAGSLLIAAAVTGGELFIPDANPKFMEVFIMKLEEMGHALYYNLNKKGIRFIATKKPNAVSFKTDTYPGFPTDLQSLMMVAQVVAYGSSNIVETVYSNRFLHVPELLKMGANINVNGYSATVCGVSNLIGATVQATDIRAACALVLAGLVAEQETIVFGVNHWRRGYQNLELKLNQLGANIEFLSTNV